MKHPATRSAGIRNEQAYFLAAREHELSRREFLASLSLAMAGCSIATEGAQPGPSALGGGSGSGTAGSSFANQTGGSVGVGGAGGTGGDTTAGGGGSGIGGQAGTRSGEHPSPQGGAGGGGSGGEGHGSGDDAPIQRIAFGSCNRLEPLGENRTPSFRSDFWAQLATQQPQVYLPLGDSVYLDYIDRYSDLAAVPGFNDFISRTIAMPIWDDHDFGSDNGGADFENRAQFKQMFLDFWSMYGAVPLDAERRFREGNYDAVSLGPAGKEVQFLMLDVRYFREPAGAMLGEQQWTWLEEQLKKPARLRILQSGSVVLASAGVSGNGQTWSSHTAEQTRLLTLLNDMGSTGVIMLSGDVHYADVSRRQGARYPYLDFTSSSLNQGKAAGAAPGGPVNEHRDTPQSAIQESNFGLVRIDWTAVSPLVQIEYRSTWDGSLLLAKALRLADLGES